MAFQLHPQLDADTQFVTELGLCRVLLMNDTRFEWLILVPRQDDIREVYDLAAPQQAQLWQEATRVGQALMASAGGEKLNIATLGNQVPQLHVHVIARKVGDAAWPGPVWGVGAAEPLDAEQAAERAARLAQALNLL